jgi:hypothetical protein
MNPVTSDSHVPRHDVSSQLLELPKAVLHHVTVFLDPHDLCSVIKVWNLSKQPISPQNTIEGCTCFSQTCKQLKTTYDKGHVWEEVASRTWPATTLQAGLYNSYKVRPPDQELPVSSLMFLEIV